ncbi:TonB-dependent receptor [Xylophilus rhododendri]|uniref:TonB-dependent receptor n=1 Tax=Xylophilus rhododendri TaxID=2697032 RepID=A0A857J2E8_9BURK|nr:TonB-dependent receptor [Xylophilus rhododendri]QHI98100.1 TonB-dependent receptor [Xylophilus rhododendri]
MFPKTRLARALALALPFAVPGAFAQDKADPAEKPEVQAPIKTLGVVTVNGGQPTSLPTQIPTTMEGITREQIERSINATDSEDALKYFPSLLVRKRYVGDYNHAILSSRASGTGNSARSAVYADSILLSNFLGNGVGGLSFPPRWGLVTPEEIERVDVMYGPFSAAYPGNSAGAVVDFVTRMPTKLEAHAKVGYTSQPFELYGTDQTFRAWQASASLGNKVGDWSWWVNVNRTDSQGQPLTFPTRLVSNGVNSGAGTAVTGAAPSSSTANAAQYTLGSGTQYNTRQDHLKTKLAYDITPTLRASYVLGLWENRSSGNPSSYLRDAAGQPVYSGAFNVNGLAYTGSQALSGSDFAATRESALHVIHGLSLKSHTEGIWDWELAASLYDYRRDDKRQNAASNPPPGAFTGGPGTLAQGAGTGWRTFAAKGTWRPEGMAGPHIVDFGYQQENYQLRYSTYNVAGNYLNDGGGSLASDVHGDTRLQSLWAQDTWRFAPDWKAVLGGRAERWEASNGGTAFSAASALAYPERHENHFSPKAAVSWLALPDTVLKASLGRAVRMPTVSELYGATSTTNSLYLNDPNLRPERSWTGELSAEKDLGNALARLTFFVEDTRDALYSQTLFDSNALRNISRVQNVGRIATRGLEAAYNGNDVLTRGLDLSGSVTYAHSVIKENDGFVSTPGDTIGKWQPNIPRWRATALASYRFNERWSTSLGARYSGRQYRTLDNSDANGFTYFGVSRYFTADLRIVYKPTRQWTVAFGIDNLNNDKYWNFHPYPQRSYTAELKWDL